jgi:hypothetical protein
VTGNGVTGKNRRAAGLLVAWAWLALAAGAAADGLGAPAGPAAELAQRLGLPGPAAAKLAAALARDAALRVMAAREAVSDDAVQELEQEFVAALAAAPENAAVAEKALGFYERWGAQLEAPAAAALDLVAHARDPALLALRLAGRPRFHARGADFLLAALAVRPDAAVLWADAAQATWRVDWKIAFLEQSFHCLVHPGAEPRPEDALAAAAVAESWLREEIAAGLAPQAMAVLARLPPAVRALVEQGATGPVATEIGGLQFTGELQDLRLDLAMVEILAGNTPAARRLLLKLPPRGASHGGYREQTAATAGAPTAPAAPAAPTAPAAPGAPAARGAPAAPTATGEMGGARAGQVADLKLRLLDRWLAASQPDDPFSLFTDVLSDPLDGGPSDGLRPVCWRLALAQAAQRESYPAIAAFVWFQAARWLGDAVAGDEPTRTGRGVPPSVLMAARGLSAEIAALAHQVDNDARAARAEMRAGLGPDPAAATIARQLREPPGPRFAALPLSALPAAWRAAPVEAPPASRQPPGPSAPPGSVAPRTAAAMQLQLPAGFTAVRVDRQDQRLAVVALSEDYDRQTSVSRGGYWVLLSDELGTTWLPPLYTGLRDNLPYTVRETSAVPLLADDRLQVEVEIKELRSHGFDASPADLAPRKPQTDIYLDIPLADLERDSDGDGLTDLAEERLLTDPEQADTDRDGLADGEDPTPNIATTDPPAPEARVLAAVLAEIVDKQLPRSAAARRQVAEAAVWPSRARPYGERTVFVVGERPMFAGLRPAHRLIVLTPEEVEALRQTVSDPCSLALDLVVLDRSGHRAFVIWSAMNQDGKLLLAERGGSWQVGIVSRIMY